MYSINCHIYDLQQIKGLTETFEDEQSTMRSQLTEKANHITELKKENKVLVGTSTVIPHNFIMISMLKGQFVSIVKPFNLTACFITTYDTKCYETHIKMAGHGQQCAIM